MITTLKWSCAYRMIWHIVSLDADGNASEALCGALVRGHETHNAPLGRKCRKCAPIAVQAARKGE